MTNDIEIRVRVANQTGSGVTAVNTSLRTLAQRATTAATAMNRLEQQAEAATRALGRLQRQANDTAASLGSLRTNVADAGTSLRTFNRHADTANTRLDTLDDRAQHTTATVGLLGAALRGAGGDLRDLRGDLGSLTVSASGASSALGSGSGGGGLTGYLIGVGAVIGTSVLPAIGAAVPMLLGFAAVGGAAALAAKDLKEEAKKLKPEFEQLQKAASKAVMPGVKRSMDDWRGAMKGLQPVVEEGGKAFGGFVEKAADFANSPAFKTSLLKNVQMGTGFFDGFTTSLLDFTQAFLDFGTKSQPSLDAFQNLFGGLLDTGLPAMFKELEPGIEGAADVINGLASLLNDSLLPSLGKISGSFADAFGPLIGEALTNIGAQIVILSDVFAGLMKIAEPFADVFADGLRAVTDVMQIGADAAGSFASNVGGALLESLMSLAGVDVSNLDGFTGFSDWVKANEPQIRAGFYNIAEAITTMVSTGISVLPTLYTAFQATAEGILTGIDVMVSGLAAAFGDLPVVGDKFKEWNTNFDEFATSARGGLDKVGDGISSLAEDAVPRLNRAKLTMNVDEASQNLTSLKEQLKDPALTKERRAKLTADKKVAEAALAKAKGDLTAFDKKEAKAKLTANATGFWGTLKKAAAASLPPKTAKVGANAKGFWGTIKSIPQTVATRQIGVAFSALNKVSSLVGFADGGVVRSYADGGTEDHSAQIASGGPVRMWAEPETGGEAYIPLSPAKRGRSREIAEETVGVLGGAVKWFAKGGVTKAEKAARKDARSDLTISRFGQLAGSTRSEFGSALAKPDSLSALTNSLNQWRSTIMKATHGSTENKLLKQLDSTGKKLIGYEKSLTKVTASLDKAKDKLNSLKDAAASLSASVKSGILSSANITGNASGGPVTTASVMAGLTASRDKATSFDSALKQLKKKGLRSDLIQQIAEAGIEGGGLETAGALLNASPSEIKSANSLQHQIAAAAGSAGKTTSDAVYKDAIAKQTAAVGRLEKSQSSLKTSMDKLTKAMEKSIEKAFGKKAAGGIVGAAASGGVRGGLTWVGEHEPELLQLPVGSRVWSGPDSRRKTQAPWTSMLNTPQRGGGSGGAASTGDASDRPIIVHQTIELDGRVVARQIFDPLRAEIAHRGGSVQKSLGQGTG